MESNGWIKTKTPTGGELSEANIRNQSLPELNRGHAILLVWGRYRTLRTDTK